VYSINRKFAYGANDAMEEVTYIPRYPGPYDYFEDFKDIYASGVEVKRRPCLQRGPYSYVIFYIGETDPTEYYCSFYPPPSACDDCEVSTGIYDY
jgi:hypothetical protein